MTTSGFWKATAERIIRTFAQALLAVLGADHFGLFNAPWTAALSTAGMAAFLALVTAVAASGDDQGPGITEIVKPQQPAMEPVSEG